MAQSELVSKWRAKFGNAYDDMDDASLEKAILSKHPEYKDLASPAPTVPTTPTTTPETSPSLAIPEKFKVDTTRDDSATEDKPKKESFLSKAYHLATDPLTDYPSRQAREEADANPSTPEDWKIPFTHGATWKGLGQGLNIGSADLISGLSSPLNLAVTAATAGAGAAEKSGLTTVAKYAKGAVKALSAPMVVHGAGSVISPESTWGDRGRGLVEIAGGLSGMMDEPHAANAPNPDEPKALLDKNPKPRYRVVDGKLIPVDDRPDLTRQIFEPPGANSSKEDLTQYGKYRATQIDAGKKPDPFALWEVNNRRQDMWSEKGAVGKNIAYKDETILPTPTKQEDDVLDESGRSIAPKQTPIYERPPGPWDNNKETGLSTIAKSVNQESPSVAFEHQDFFKRQGEGVTKPKPESDWGPNHSNGSDPQAGDFQKLEIPKSKLTDDEIANYQAENLVIAELNKTKHSYGVDSEEYNSAKNELEQMMQFNNSKNVTPKQKQIEGPLAMRVPGSSGNIAVGGASPRTLGVLASSLYSKDLPSVVTKELLQNSFDEHRIAGVHEPVKVLYDHNVTNPETGQPGTAITVRDRGRGMTPKELYTSFTDVGETGKANEESASGGFGFAKAAPLLGGKYVQIKSIVKEGGKNVMYSFEGTKPQLIDQLKGVGLKREETTLPTGLQVTTHFSKDTSFYNAKNLGPKMATNSPSITSNTHIGENYGSNPNDVNEFLNSDKPNYFTKKYVKEHQRMLSPQPLQDTLETPGASIKLHYNEGSPDVENSQYRLHILNKGLYQNSDERSFGGFHGVTNTPKDIYADVTSKVEEGHEDYPFNASREQLSEKTDSAIRKWVRDNLVSGAMQKQRASMEGLYKSMQAFPNKGNRGSVLFDPGDRLTPVERKSFENSPVMQGLISHLDTLVDDVFNKVGRSNWSDRVENVGITLDPTVYGMHIPNPNGSGKSTILFNPLEHILHNADNAIGVKASALETVITGLHEIAHVGEEDSGMTSNVKKGEINDPRIGRYLESYFDQLQTHGSLAGHAADWLKRLGEVYTKVGPVKSFEAADGIEKVITDESGGYNPEIQRILQIYKDTKGRPNTTQDFLSRTGVKSETPPTGEGDVPSGNNTDGTGTTPGVNSEGAKSLKDGTVIIIKSDKSTPGRVKQARAAGFEFEGVNDQGDFRFKKTSSGGKQQPILETEVGQNRPTAQNANRQKLGPPIDKKKLSVAGELLSLPRSLESSVDLSAPLRQGLGLIHKSAFWKALPGMFRAWGSEAAFQEIQKSISERPLFKERIGPGGKILPSFAEDAGLKLTDLESLSSREESLMSSWSEKVPGVRPSNRAYTAFLNKLRADTFESLVHNAQTLADTAKKTGEARPGFIKKSFTQTEAEKLNPLTNASLARGLADFVNTATGRGSLKMGKLNLEPAAVALNQVLFSPRLIASRVKMLNPAYYVMANPMVRKEALKSLIAIAAAGTTLTQLGKMFKMGTVEPNPASADFGKLKMGNARLDPYGGFQQYIVATQRLLPELDRLGIPTGGRMKSTNTPREYSLGNPKYGGSSRASTLGRFVRGKTSPLVGFAWSMLDANTDLSGNKQNFTSMNPMQNSIAKLFIPMLIQDVYELSTNEKGKHLGLAVPDAFGMSVQQYADR